MPTKRELIEFVGHEHQMLCYAMISEAFGISDLVENIWSSFSERSIDGIAWSEWVEGELKNLERMIEKTMNDSFNMCFDSPESKPCDECLLQSKFCNDEIKRLDAEIVNLEEELERRIQIKTRLEGKVEDLSVDVVRLTTKNMGLQKAVRVLLRWIGHLEKLVAETSGAISEIREEFGDE